MLARSTATHCERRRDLRRHSWQVKHLDDSGERMSDAYTVLWTKDRCRHLKQSGQVGSKLTVLFGGPHLSQPRFSRFGVKPGDYLYLIHVADGVLYILGRMRVKRLLTPEEYVAANPRMFRECEDKEDAGGTLDNWLKAHPQKRYLIWSCTDEVAVGKEGTRIRFDIALSPQELEGLRFRSKRGERGLKHVEGGQLKRVIGLDGGVYRLSPHSAALFERLVDAAPSKATP
jgi:hypothetical protein